MAAPHAAPHVAPHPAPHIVTHPAPPENLRIKPVVVPHVAAHSTNQVGPEEPPTPRDTPVGLWMVLAALVGALLLIRATRRWKV